MKLGNKKQEGRGGGGAWNEIYSLKKNKTKQRKVKIYNFDSNLQ